VSETTQELNLTTAPVELPGVQPADAPTEMLPGKLWHGGIPVDFDFVHRTGIQVMVDLSDADSYPPAEELEQVGYLKCPLVDEDALPDEAMTRGLAQLVAGLIEQGRRVLVHCTFGRNRSGLVVTLIVREVLGLSGAEALAYVQERREGTVNNDTFAAWLRSLPAPRG